MKKIIASVVLASVAIAPAVSSAPALASDVPAVELSNAQQADATLHSLDKAIGQLKAEEASAVKTDYRKEITDLLNTALEWRTIVEDIVTGRIPNVDIATIKPRIELTIQIAHTIETASQKLRNKVEDAHVQLGFAVTRAVLRVLNITATKEMLADSAKDLKAVLDRVSNYPDLKPTDRATIYTKAALDKKIWETRFDRDKNILGKVDFEVYNELNGDITHAVGVQLNPNSTVAEVNQAITDLDAAYKKAASHLK